ncbi:MAG: hypothetical protein HY959_04160 [Ignavibacteriae bacterium]|nr:hypothetical protein [Ignavibacteriota bacterium]
MNKYFVLILISVIFLCNKLYAQISFEPNITLKGDLTTGFTLHTFGANADVDFFHNKKIIPSYAGIRLSTEYFYVSKSNFTLDGSSVNTNKNEKGTTYTNVDFLGRITVSAGVFDFDFCPGVYYNKSDKPDSKENGVYGKVAVDAKLKLVKNTAGLIFKFAYGKQNYGGIGIYFGFSTRDK